MRALQIGAWVAGIVLLLGWSQMILGVAVFAIPDRYGAPESLVLSVIALAIGVAVPAGILWALLAQGVISQPRRVRVVTRASGLPALEGGGEHAPALLDEPAQLEEPLTEREVDVLRLVAAGKSNKEIAQELVISVGTVKTHTNNLYRKLSVRNRTEAVAAAQRRRLI